MKLKKADSTFIDIKVLSVAREISINYELVETTSSVVRSIDRGALTDTYKSTFTVRGVREYVYEVYKALNELRMAQMKVELSECEEMYFADNIDHSGTLDCVMIKVGKLTSPKFKVQEFTFTVALDAPLFIGTSELPDLKCLQMGYESYNSWNTLTNETYYGGYYFVDHEEDTYVFRGNYIIDVDSSAKLLNYRRSVRGSTIMVNESDFGVVGMFGPNVTGTSHNVIITNMKYVDLSVDLRSYEIELLRVKV